MPSVHDAHRRHAAYYLRVLLRVGARYRRGGCKGALTRFDLEWPQIQAAQTWAATEQARDVTAARMCVAYAGACPEGIERRLHARDYIRLWLEPALAAARARGMRTSEAYILGNLGSANSWLGEHAHAAGYHKRAVVILRRSGDKKGYAHELGSLGVASSHAGQTERAVKYHRRALAIYRELDEKSAQRRELTNMASDYLRMGYWRRARGCLREAWRLAKEGRDLPGKAGVLDMLAELSQHAGKYDQAVSYSQKAMAIRHALGGRRAANSLAGIGQVHYEAGRYDEASQCQSEALEAAREMGSRDSECRLLLDIGMTRAKQGRYDDARECYQQALAIARETGDRAAVGMGLGNLGILDADEGQVEQAIHCFEEALQIARETKHKELEANQLGNLGTVYVDLGDPRRAIECLREALTIHRAIRNHQGERTTLGELGLAYLTVGEHDEAIRLFENALAQVREVKNETEEALWLFHLRQAHTAKKRSALEQRGGPPAKTAADRKPTCASEDVFPPSDAMSRLTAAVKAATTADHTAEADGRYLDALARYPEAKHIRLEYATLLDWLGRNAEAVPILREGLRRSRNDAALATQLAWALVDSGGHPEEIDAVFRIAEKSPQARIPLADSAAWYLFRQGEYEEALEVQEPALELVDEVPEIAYHAGAILAALGQREEAKDYLALALQHERPFSGRSAAELLLKQIGG
jgi:tetratricopeptide (TPR) repeat protein